MTISFLMAGGVALIGIILVLIFDRPKRPKNSQAEGQKHAKEAGHHL
jgi:hypothetical protein